MESWLEAGVAMTRRRTPRARVGLSASRLAGLAAMTSLLVAVGAAAPAAKTAGAGKTQAKAPTATLNLKLIDPFAESLPLGSDTETIFQWLRVRLDGVYGPRIKAALDANERSELRVQLSREMEALRSSVVRFDGNRTGFEVSVVAGEFAPGTGEGLLIYREGKEVHYLFLIQGRLWKYARPLPATEPFEQRVRKIETDAGQATRSDGGGGRPDAAWTGLTTRLRLADRRVLYEADLLVVEDRDIADRIVELRGGKSPITGQEDLDPELEEFLDRGASE